MFSFFFKKQLFPVCGLFIYFFISITCCFTCYVFETIAYPVVVNQDPMIIPIISFFPTEDSRLRSAGFGSVSSRSLSVRNFICFLFLWSFFNSFQFHLYHFALHMPFFWCLSLKPAKRITRLPYLKILIWSKQPFI